MNKIIQLVGALLGTLLGFVLGLLILDRAPGYRRACRIGLPS